MHSAYPLLVDQRDWGLGEGQHQRAGSAELLRAIGADLTRPNPFVAASAPGAALRDFEIIVTDPPLHAAAFAHEYPQAFCDGGPARHSSSSSSSIRLKRKLRPTTLEHSAAPLPNRVGVNRAHQRLDLNLHPEVEVFEVPISRRRPPATTLCNHSSSPRNSPHLSNHQRSPRTSPRLSNQRSPRGSPHLGNHRTPSTRKEYVPITRGPLLQEEGPEARNWTQRGDPTQAAMADIGVHSSYALTSIRRPNQFVLCCSPPDYYYSTERLRQEPEPGLCDCCETKVYCCCSCCHTWFPTGNVNSVCTSLICFGIILFIVLSPLLHYLVPT